MSDSVNRTQHFLPTTGPQLLRAVPQLPALNLERARDFYVEQLGFQLLGIHPDLLILRRDGVELHLWYCTEPAVAENSSCYFHVDQIEALHAKYNALGLVHPQATLRDQPWGMREFYVMDDSGNLLKFGQRLPPQA